MLKFISCFLTFLIGQPDVTRRSSAFCSRKADIFCFTSSISRYLDILTHQHTEMIILTLCKGVLHEFT